MVQIALPQLPTLKGRLNVILTLPLTVSLNQAIVLALFLNKSFGKKIRYTYGMHSPDKTQEDNSMLLADGN